MKHKAVAFGESMARRIEADGVLKGFALMLSDDKWGAFGTDDVRLTPAKFDTPRSVARWFDQ